ncbi:MAG: hypothetical protein CM1200mP13_12240 [Candidatus Pelagibacterales bacterium]|nr:MAG: hypothetical protein CM1200mP13_12240 [Pelagibacterales bacterium]
MRCMGKSSLDALEIIKKKKTNPQNQNQKRGNLNHRILEKAIRVQ